MFAMLSLYVLFEFNLALVCVSEFSKSFSLSKLNAKNLVITYQLNINMKKFEWRKCRKIFLEAIFFSFWENFLQSFCPKFWSPFYVTSLA